MEVIAESVMTNNEALHDICRRTLDIERLTHNILLEPLARADHFLIDDILFEQLSLHHGCSKLSVESVGAC